MFDYRTCIGENFDIVDKSGKIVPFTYNSIQAANDLDESGKDVVLKARKQGFSSKILARYTCDFILRPNSRSVIVADNKDNAIALLDRVKFFLKSYEEKNQIEIPLKYNSKYELVNSAQNTRYFVGTAENAEFGRSQDITNLHFSEAAFYPNFDKLRASALQATVENAHVIVETTANGFNQFKTFWDDSKKGLTGFKPLFYKASAFYSAEFLAEKRKELKRTFPQEYPETDMEAFLTSGETYFDKEALSEYFKEATEPVVDGRIFA